jgi:hypothetical protein
MQPSISAALALSGVFCFARCLFGAQLFGALFVWRGGRSATE